MIGLLQVIPLCWSLMQSKSQPAYESVLTLIRTHLGEWSFTKVVCDFEDAIINAFRLVFNVDTQGCLFHSADVSSSCKINNPSLCLRTLHINDQKPF